MNNTEQAEHYLDAAAKYWDTRPKGKPMIDFIRIGGAQELLKFAAELINKHSLESLVSRCKELDERIHKEAEEGGEVSFR